MDEIDFVSRCVTAPGVGNSTSNDSLRRVAAMCKVQMKYNRVEEKLNSINSESHIWRALAQKWGDSNDALRPLLLTSSNAYKLRKVQLLVVSEKIDAVTFG